jgi:hypothetical protein
MQTLTPLLFLLATLAAGAPTCTNVTLSIAASANNYLLPSESALPFTDPSLLINTVILDAQEAITYPVSGTYTIKARFCQPETFVASHANTLQLLVHGVTYDRNYWQEIFINLDRMLY